MLYTTKSVGETSENWWPLDVKIRWNNHGFSEHFGAFRWISERLGQCLAQTILEKNWPYHVIKLVEAYIDARRSQKHGFQTRRWLWIWHWPTKIPDFWRFSMTFDTLFNVSEYHGWRLLQTTCEKTDHTTWFNSSKRLVKRYQEFPETWFSDSSQTKTRHMPISGEYVNQKMWPHIMVRKPEVFLSRIHQSNNFSTYRVLRYLWGVGRHIILLSDFPCSRYLDWPVTCVI